MTEPRDPNGLGREVVIRFFQTISRESEYLENMDRKIRACIFSQESDLFEIFFSLTESSGQSQRSTFPSDSVRASRENSTLGIHSEGLLPQGLSRHIPLSSHNLSHPRCPFLSYAAHSHASSPFSLPWFKTSLLPWGPHSSLGRP